MSFYQAQYDNDAPYYGAPVAGSFQNEQPFPYSCWRAPSQEHVAFPQPALYFGPRSNPAPFPGPPALPLRPLQDGYPGFVAPINSRQPSPPPWPAQPSQLNSHQSQLPYDSDYSQSNTCNPEFGSRRSQPDSWTTCNDSYSSRVDTSPTRKSCCLPDNDTWIPQTNRPQEMSPSRTPDTELGCEYSAMAQKAMANAAQTPAAIKALGQDIKRATNQIANTLENFKQVRSKLSLIDSWNLVEEKFAPDWQKLYDKYYDILALSKTHANEIAAFGTQFDKNIRKHGHPSSDISAAIRIELIRNSLQITKKFQRESAALEKHIDELSCGLSDIAERLKPEFFAEDRKFDLENELEQIICRIEEIKREIGTVDQQISHVAKKLNATEIGDGIATAVIPSFGLMLLQAGTRSGQDRNELEKLKSSRDDMEQERAGWDSYALQTHKSLGQIAGARVLLHDVQDQISDIRDALKFFAQVWAGIKGRCDEIVLFLQNGNLKSTSMMGQARFFLEFTELPQTYYSALGDVLRDFAKGLANFTGP